MAAPAEIQCECGFVLKVPARLLGRTFMCVKCRRHVPTTKPEAPDPRPTGSRAMASTAEKVVASPTRAAKPPKPAAPPPTPAAPTVSKATPPKPPKRRLGEMLVEEGLITETDLKQALRVQERQGGKLAEVLIAEGLLTTGRYVNFLAKRPGTASIELPNYEIPGELISLIPRDFARKHEVLPLDRLGRHLTVGMACPLDAGTVTELEGLIEMRVCPVLCAPGDVRAALDTYYGEDAPGAVETARVQPGPAGSEPVSRQLRHLTALHTLPDTIERAHRAVKDPVRAKASLAEVVGSDPPAAARLLSIANADAYGFRGQVSRVNMATSLLGFRATYSTVAELETLGPEHACPHFDRVAFWKRCSFCARLATALAAESRCRNVRGASAAALLHGVGRIALAQLAPRRYAQVGSGLEGVDLAAREKEIFGLGHDEAGYVLCQLWKLPDEIAEAVRFCYHPGHATKARRTVALVALAVDMAPLHVSGAPSHDRTLDLSSELLQRADVSERGALEAFHQTCADLMIEAL